MPLAIKLLLNPWMVWIALWLNHLASCRIAKLCKIWGLRDTERVKVQQKEQIAVAIACYYFHSGTAAIAPLLNLTNSGSDAINEVAVAYLCGHHACSSTPAKISIDIFLPGGGCILSTSTCWPLNTYPSGLQCNVCIPDRLVTVVF